MQSDVPNSDAANQATPGGNDEAEFAKLFLIERRRVLGFIRQILPASLAPLVDPTDVWQDTVVEAFRSRGTFTRTGDDSAFQWLAVIAKNQVLNLIRAQQTA